MAKFEEVESSHLSGFATGASLLCYFSALQMGDAAKVASM
jgi:uncharacterized membrane protein